ncbi:stAR-related lipid transfer protein 6 isoform X7 [Saimiri boliviensis]|uniref:stAR-related lipid transfer protein 6 isoform X7 n=1 Tax=Saimiri boliviensis TaxID=27679 RepID=UPI003D776743
MGLNKLPGRLDSRGRMAVTQHGRGTRPASPERGTLYKQMERPTNNRVKISLTMSPSKYVPARATFRHQDTFICHTITQSFAMGSISPRDFIDLVYIKRYEGNMNIISSKSVDFPEYPPSSNYIRGYNHPCGFVCSPMKENPAYSRIVMFVQTEMRGKLSPSIIEKTMPSNLVNIILNAKDGIKAHKTPSRRGFHRNRHS